MNHRGEVEGVCLALYEIPINLIIQKMILKIKLINLFSVFSINNLVYALKTNDER